MPQFSEKSQAKLSQCHKDLQRLMNEVIKHYDCTIVTGHRTEADQERMFDKNLSKVQWPDSKHNKMPSMAVDVVKYKHGGIDWDNNKDHYHFAGFVMGLAAAMDIELRWGGDWDSDLDLDDQKFNDLIHFELK